jgi:hypothetical protein
MTWPCTAHEGWHNLECLVCTTDERYEQEIQSLKSELARVQQDKHSNDTDYLRLSSELNAERTLTAKLREALEYYASIDGWKPHIPYPSSGRRTRYRSVSYL